VPVMVFLFLFPLCLIFVEMFILLKVMENTQSIFLLSRQALGVLVSKEISDDEKEVFMRKRSLALFKVTIFFTFKFLSIFAFLFAVYFIVNYFSPSYGKIMSDGLYSMRIVAVLTAGTMLYVWIRNSFSRNYNIIERLLHYVAFCSPVVQKSLSELENDMFKAQLKDTRSEREVFITALPRAGTTLILELLYTTGEFHTFTYRHMPFILCPVLWAKCSKIFQKSGKIIERTHGDGMNISFDSPEAFEEIIWITYLKKKIVQGDTLSPLTPKDKTPEFAEAIQGTVKKLLLETQRESTPELRYLSKNNANYSRIELVADLFPTSIMIVPFRQPLNQVSSLMKQHTLFTDRHKHDRFSRLYMKWLGHYDFGANFKPINFRNWVSSFGEVSYSDPDFWLRYWIIAYTHVLENKTSSVVLFDFDMLLKDGAASLTALADCLGLADKDSLVAQTSRLRSPTTTRLPGSDRISTDILRQAHDVFKRLQARAINVPAEKKQRGKL
jgi:Sulfotransferase family